MSSRSQNSCSRIAILWLAAVIALVSLARSRPRRISLLPNGSSTAGTPSSTQARMYTACFLGDCSQRPAVSNRIRMALAAASLTTLIAGSD